VTDAAAPATAAPWTRYLLQFIVIYFVGLRLWFDIGVTPMGDEAYYWMWGQHLSWSYLDHPPLDGWLQGAVAAIFGWSNFTVRLLTWLSFAGTLWVLWLWAKRLAPEAAVDWFWRSAVAYLCIPVVGLMTSIAFHDHLLLFFVLASAYLFHGFATGWEAGTPRWRTLYGAAALLGLAVLTKYNGVFLGLGYAVWVIARPQLRRLLLTPHLWLAALLAIAMQAPVIYWNVTDGLASLRFHLAERPNLNWTQPRLAQVQDFAITMLVSMSPLLFQSLFRIPWLKPNEAERRAVGLGLSVYLTGTLAFAVIAAYVVVFFHWNIVAYAALAPVAYRLLGRRIAYWLHVAFGLVLVSGALLTYTLTPLNLLGVSDRGAAANYGWPELAARVVAQQEIHPQSFIAAARYTYAAQLGFMLHDPSVPAFNALPSQTDTWWNPAVLKGRDAIIVADNASASTIAGAQGKFTSLEKLEEVPVTDRFGKTIWTFQIWLGRGYSGG
jgi:4-amino-4-deoxy-L-arabinose transferase-like glycosyltransferase